MKRAFAHIGFSVAITLIVMCLASTKFVIASTIGLAILFIASLCLSYFRENASVPLCIGSALLACVLMLGFNKFVVAPQQELDGTRQDISFYTIDLEDMDSYGNYIYKAKLTDGKKIRVKSEASLDADCYTIINARAEFHSLGDSAYGSYGYWSDGIYLTATIDKFTVTDSVVRSPMVHILHLRQEIVSAFEDAIGDNEAGIAIALVTGNKKGISRLTYDYFRFSGATHIMAVSGLHLSVVAGGLYLLMRRVKINDYVSSVVTILVILSYIALAGFSKSVVRAGVMMIVMVVAPLFKAYGDSINSLGLAVFLICLNPYAVTDVSALLSVLSTLAMIIASRILPSEKANFDTPPKKKLILNFIERFNSVFFSIFVLLFTLPVIYIYYGYITVASILANIVVVPLGSVAMMLCVATFGFYKLGIAQLIAKFTKSFIHLIIVFLRFVSSNENSIVPLGEYFALVIAGVLVIIAVCFIFANSVLLKKGVAISLVLVIVSSGIIYGYTKDSSYAYVTKNGACVVVHNGDTIVGGISNLDDCYDVKSFLVSHNEDIDLLINNGDADSSVALTQSIHTDIVLTHDLDENILDNGCFDDIEVKNNCVINFDDMTLRYRNDNYTVSIGDVDVYVGKAKSNADICVNRINSSIKDRSGLIDLTYGDIVYIIKDNGFSARRVNSWQE